MTDEIDMASDRDQIARDCAIAAARKAVAITATGNCFYCGEPVITGLRFCNADCRDGWQIEQDAKRRNKRG